VTKRLQLLIELAPRTTRIGYLIGSTVQIQGMPPDLAPAGTHLVYAVGRHPDELDQAFALFLREGCDALYDPGQYPIRFQIIAFALQHRMPSIHTYREAVEDGGLMSYGPDFVDDSVLAAEIFDRILRGAKPADLPIQQLNKYEFLINRKTAVALGLTIPPALLFHADEVIE
jgi:putative ABC transport system substrate-binding protein